MLPLSCKPSDQTQPDSGKKLVLALFVIGLLGLIAWGFSSSLAPYDSSVDNTTDNPLTNPYKSITYLELQNSLPYQIPDPKEPQKLMVDMGGVQHLTSLELALQGASAFLLTYFKGPRAIVKQRVPIYHNTVSIPQVVSSTGFDRLMIEPFGQLHIDKLSSQQLLGAANQRDPKQVERFEDLRKLELVIPDSSLDQLKAMEDLVKGQRFVLAESKQWVKAKILLGDKKYKVDIRLKGDLTDHINKRKRSYRVKVKGGETILGMRVFSIQSPETREFLYEWLWHEAYRYFGGVAPRYDFVSVSVNQEELGIFALEEAFEKRMLEFHQRRESPILKFGEDIYWILYAHELGYRSDEEMFGSSVIQTFQPNRTLAIEIQNEAVKHAASLIRKFRKGELTPDQVFDTQRMSIFLALSDLFKNTHGVRWNNVRYYYDPIVSRLEPIAFDASSAELKPQISYTRELQSLYRQLFDDSEFLARYIRDLARFSDVELINNFWKSIEKDYTRFKFHLSKEYPEREFFGLEFLTQSGKHLTQVFKLPNAVILYPYEQSETTPYRFIATSVHELPTSISGCQLDSTPDQPLILPGVKPHEAPPYQLIQCTNKPSSYQVWGTKVDQELSYQQFLPDDLAQTFGLDKGLESIKADSGWKEVEFLIFNKDSKTITLIPGDWQITTDLIIPAGYTVVAQPGFNLDLKNTANFISYSRVQFVGERQDPIRFFSSQSDGGGFALLGEITENSDFQYVEFINLSAPSRVGFRLTGAVTAYRAPVTIKHSVFKDNRSEDALNIIRSRFVLASLIFDSTQSDAFDSDFSEGSLIKSIFSNTGNDAVDVSGSSVWINSLLLENIGDKGVSTGENSFVSGNGITVQRAAVGLASKDLSKLQLAAADLSDVKIGIAVYQKKPEFGPATVIVNDLKLAPDTSMPYLIQNGSSVIVAGQEIVSKQRKKENLLIERLIEGLPIN